MNAKQWRARGYHTIFRAGRVYLYHPSTDRVVTIENGAGLWMRHDDADVPPWMPLPEHDSTPVREIALVCYCDAGVETCDFCSGVRPHPVMRVAPAALRVGDVLLSDPGNRSTVRAIRRHAGVFADSVLASTDQGDIAVDRDVAIYRPRARA